MANYREIFISFVKIGSFTLGGGYAMVHLIQQEVVEKKQWINKNEFVDMLALAQSSPGPIALNTALFVGYKLKGVKGAIVAALSSILPPFFIILLVALFFSNIQNNVWFIKGFKAIRPAVVALIAVPVIKMGKTVGIRGKNIIIPILTVILIVRLNLSPVLIIALAALAGVIYQSYYKK
jgi:chromate transporter